MTVLDTIWAEITRRLMAMPGAPGAIDIEPAGDPDQFPAIELYDHGYSVLDRMAEATRYALTFELTGFVEGSGGVIPTAARNALHAASVAALMQDGQLGGLVDRIDDGDRRNHTAVLAERRRLAFSQDFTIEFVTRAGQPGVAA